MTIDRSNYWQHNKPAPMSDQTNLNVLLDGIEERGRLSYNADELRAVNFALVKALRKAQLGYELLRDMGEEAEPFASPYAITKLEEITAILQASSEPKEK